MQPHIDALTDKERGWLRSHLDGARRFVDTFAPECAGQPITPGALDLAWTAWLQSAESDPEHIQAVIDAVGSALGQLLTDEGVLTWVVVREDQRSDLALHGLPGRGDVLICPADLVARQWQRRETQFLKHCFFQILGHVRAMQAPSAPPDRSRPWGRQE